MLYFCLRYFLLEDPVTKTRVLHNVMKVLENPETDSKVIDSVLQIVYNLVAKPVSQEDMETEEDDKNTDGIQAVLPELDRIISYFNNYMKIYKDKVIMINKQGKLDKTKKKDKEKIRKIKEENSGIQRKLDIFRSLAPFINDPTTAYEFIQQLLSLTLQVEFK